MRGLTGEESVQARENDLGTRHIQGPIKNI